MILIEEVSHVHDQIANDRQTGQRAQYDRFGQLEQVGRTSQTVLTVDVHGI